MDPKDRIIVALDVDNLELAKALVAELAPHVGAFKVGLELLTAAGAPQVVAELQTAGTKIFFDGKFNDIPNTVAGAIRAAVRLGVWMVDVHTTGGLEMMSAARESAESAAKSLGRERPLIIGVTVLTSLDAKRLSEVGFDVDNDDDLKKEVKNLALLAKSAGLDGVVASPQEIPIIRETCGPDFKIVTPGVRPCWAARGDQKRAAAPKEAVVMGADYLVIGRPITRPPGQIGSPADAAKMIAKEIGGTS